MVKHLTHTTVYKLLCVCDTHQSHRTFAKVYTSASTACLETKILCYFVPPSLKTPSYRYSHTPHKHFVHPAKYAL